jgi:mannose-6-phosphate isomerase-like protein (cupin superfamily)
VSERVRVVPEESVMPSLELLFSAEDVLLKRLVLAPGQEVPWHLHRHVRDTFYVLRGPVTIFTREPESSLTLESADVFQAGVLQPHRVFNASEHEVSALLIQGMGTYDFHKISNE